MEIINPLIKKGIEDSRRAFIGPKIVQIDLTGVCNNNCIGCWVHSPFIKNPPCDKNITLPFPKVKNLIEDLSRIGTEEIFLSGAGEPFLHPNILEIIELIKSKGFKLNIITNFSLIDEKIARKLVDVNVDMITASIWAASAEIYKKTHPGKTHDDFYKIKDNISRLFQEKAKKDSYLPFLKIYNVICNINYKEIQKMIDFAIDINAQAIEFQVMDVFENQTSFLGLTTLQAKEIKEQFLTLTKHKALFFKEIGSFKINFPRDEELKEFSGRFIRIPPNFFLKEWIENKDSTSAKALRSLICPKGFSTVTSKNNPFIDEINNKITFKFLQEQCKNCLDFGSFCPVDKDFKIGFNYLMVFNFGSFLRRINSSNLYEQIYDKDAIDNNPCYVGWIYSRVLSTGEVIPCCKAVSKPLGTIYKKRFLDIWNADSYKEFREKAKTLTKSGQYFKEINCYKSCDNLSMNLRIKDLVSLNKGKQILGDEINKKYENPGKNALPEAKRKIIILANKFNKGNFNINEYKFGKNIVIDGGKNFGFAEYKISFNESGKYDLWFRYATEELRPVSLYFNGRLVTNMALNSTTSGWSTDDLRWFKEASFDINQGVHTLKIHTLGLIPHIHSFAFIKGIKHNQQKSKRYLSEDIYQKPSTLKLLRDKFKTLGFTHSIFKLLNYIRSGRLIENYLDILGIFNGSYALKGPFHVQIDLTNNCNNACIACWCNSPLLGNRRLSLEEKQKYLPLGLTKELLDEIRRMGATEIYFSGSGEPFMHPHIIEILEYTKKRNLTCHVNTNFTLLDKQKINYLIDIGVDFLTVSIWAATPQTYIKTHTNRRDEDFYKIKENLIYLNKFKKSKPYIKLYNVIFNMNYLELEKMISFAQETKSESLEFTLVDTIPGATDKLSLNDLQLKELNKICNNIKSNLDNRNKLKDSGLLIFQFDNFLRRISVSRDAQEAKYDRNIIDSMPCYIGWLFARIIPNGEVHSCLKAHRIPAGSLYKNRFSEIWNYEKQRDFRRKTLVCKKSDPFFRLIGNDPNIKEAGCYKSCDDIGRNIWMHTRIKLLTAPEKIALKSIAKSYEISRKLKPKKVEYKRYHNNPLIAGIIHGRKAFVGPEQVVVDATNKCNLRCTSCWLYSPYLTKDKPLPELLKKELPKKTLVKLIDDLSSMGTRRIRFTGGGEPFMHKDLMEIIEYACKKNLLVAITTNFGLVSRKDIKRLVDLGLEELCVSIWASKPHVYSKVHYNASGLYFEKLKENLIYLKEIKRDKPCVTFANVIMNTNFRDFENMYNFGLKYGADALYFTIMDVMPNQTDRLLLNENERKELLNKSLEIKERNKRDNIELEFFDGFLRRISKPEESFTKGEYDKIDIDKIPCYVGWIFSRILADGSVVPCCRGVKKIMGNINKVSFKNIWNSLKYNEFRAKAKYLSKSDPYFKDIGCIKECDNLMHNEEMHRRLNGR